jgi:hypothetical protein
VGSTWVIQKYIENPLLIGGRKFDIRAYVLVTPDNKVYLYNDAYVRTSGTAYNINDLSDRWGCFLFHSFIPLMHPSSMHVCNFSVCVCVCVCVWLWL